MIDTAASFPSVELVETAFREELARADAMAETVVPILRHLLSNDDNSVLSDEVVARVRGMATDLAVQILDRLTELESPGERAEHDPDTVLALTTTLTGSAELLSHLHALALEWQLTERLHSRLALDPVLSPLLQALIASQDSETAALAMKLLASQARFCQSQRRMQHPLMELPGDLLHGALLAMREVAAMQPGTEQRADAAEAAIRASYDEGAGRLGLTSRIVTGMGGGAIAALSIAHAGTAIFLSALAIGSGQNRDAAALSTAEGQLARLALALRRAGLKPDGVEREFLAIHPEVSLPEGFSRLGAERAAAILAGRGSCSEG